MFAIPRHRLCCAVLSLAAWCAAARAAEETAPPLAAPAGPPAPQAAAAKPYALPAGEARPGWEAYVKNDFAAAEAAFKKAVEKDGKDLLALEGLRATHVARGNYKEAQAVNLQMVLACPGNVLCNIFAARAMDALPYVESRAAVLETFNKIEATAAGSVAANVRDQIASLYQRVNKPEEARKALQNLGYIDKWQFVAGPFGESDKNEPIERRFAPERALKTLEFSDGGKPVRTKKDVDAPYRAVNLSDVLPGARGVFYAFVNLESDDDQDAILGVVAPPPYRLFLRGMPVMQEPGEEQFRRAGGELVRTRLVKGSNPILIKMAMAGSVTVRIFGPDYGLLKNVRLQPLPEAALAAHEVSTVRGFLMGRKVPGASADLFLQRVPADERKSGKGLRELAGNGTLSLPEAGWLDLAAQRENDVHTRLVIARTLAASFPNSAGVLDVAASILHSAGSTMGNNDSREGEEARRMREHALAQVPNSHQHLLGMYYFFSDRDLADQAFEKIKACVAAHPHSPLALTELAKVHQNKQFTIEAERCYEQAAQLDDVYLGRLVYFHEYSGNRVRARELRKKQIELGQLDPEAQFEYALSSGELDLAERLLTQQQKAYPDRAQEFAGLRVRLTLERGDVDAAYALQKTLYESRPPAPANRATLMALVDLGLRVSKDAETKALLGAYLKENPGDFELRRRLRSLEGGDLPRWWENFDVKVAQIDTSKFDNKNYPAANHAWIVDFMVTKIMPDLSRESYVHIAQKVLNLQGINELSEVLVQAQRQDLVFVRTVNPDGSTFEPQNVHSFNLAQSASLYKVGPGSILEHAYLEHADANKEDPFLSMGFNFNAIDAPRAVSRWIVMIPDEAKPRLNIRKICPDLIDEKNLPGPPGYTVYQWTNKQVEGIKREQFMPGEGDQEVIPLVLLETPDRPYRANRYLARSEKEFLPPAAAEEARKIVAAAAAQELGDAGKFDALLAWVRANINPGNDSRTLDDVWYSRTGNNGQMTILLREMAQSAGLKVRSAYVNGAYAPGRVWRSKNARREWEPGQLGNFDSGGHVLVLEQSFGPDRWAQFVGNSPKFYNPVEYNAGQSGSLALTIGDDGARIMRMNGVQSGQTTSTHRIEVALDDAGSAKIKGQVQLFGNVGGSIREAMSDPRRKPQIKEWMARHAWPKIQNIDIAVKAEEIPELPLGFLYSGTVKGLAGSADGTFFLQPFLNRPRILDLRGARERQNDILFKAEASDLDHTVTYLAPEGHAWVEVPDDVFVCTQFGFYLADYNVRGRTLTCTRSYVLPAQRITPELYPKLQEFLKHVADDSQQRIGYAKLKTETFGEYLQPAYATGYSKCGD